MQIKASFFTVCLSLKSLFFRRSSSISAALTTMAQADQFVYNQNISATNVTIYVTQNTITTADGTSRYYFYSQAHQNKTWTTEHLPARKSKLSINGLIRQVCLFIFAYRFLLRSPMLLEILWTLDPATLSLYLKMLLNTPTCAICFTAMAIPSSMPE